MEEISSESRDKEQVREFPFRRHDFDLLADLVHQKTGIVLKPHKMNMVYNRLARRLRKLGIQSFADYLVFLNAERGANEISALMNAITTNLTRFFREEHHFTHLYNEALNSFVADLKEQENPRLRLWSAGCSSGEEPYSMAMSLHRSLKEHDLLEIDAKILATDLDSAMLEKGRKGVFSSSVLENVPSEYRHWFHSTREGEFKVDSSLRRYISFKPLNLNGEWPMRGPFDVIFCRNVLIYFDGPSKDLLSKRFANILKPGGWLYLGHSERLSEHEKRLRLHGRTIYQKLFTANEDEQG